MRTGSDLRMMNDAMKLSAISSQRSAGNGPVAHAPGSAFRPLPSAFCPLPSAFCPLPSAPRRAFTLTELLVSLAILVGMMTLVATIFSTASKSSGQAQASSQLYRQLLQVSDTIRGDLRNTQGATRALGIAGVTVQAYDKAGGRSYAHRADVLMLITQETFQPYVYQGTGTYDAVRQIVYGHANRGKLDPTGAWMTGSVRYVEGSGATVGTSDMPASEWLLGRRVVGFADPLQLDRPADASTWPSLVDGRLTGTTSELPGTSYKDFTDVMGVPAVVGPPPYPAGYAGLASAVGAGSFKYGASGLYDCTIESGANVFHILPLTGMEYWFDPADRYWWQQDAGAPGVYHRWELGNPVPPLPPPPPGKLGPAVLPLLWSPFTTVGNRAFWPQWFYNGSTTRTQIDPSPPPGMSDRMASYFLPACAEFKVEYTYDDPREIAVYGGGNTPSALDYQPVLLDSNGDGTPDVPPVPAPMSIRWQTVPPGELYVWSGLSVESAHYDPTITGDLRDRTFPYRWPRAVRITIRAYAPGGALDYPIEQSIIHVWN